MSRLPSSKRFQYPKNRILKSNISQLPFSPLSAIASPHLPQINRENTEPTLTTNIRGLNFTPSSPLRNTPVIHLHPSLSTWIPQTYTQSPAWLWISFFGNSTSEITFFSIVKIRYILRETTRFLRRKPPRKNPSNTIRAWITGNLTHFTIIIGPWPVFFLGVT